jgi:translocation and assembly module TamA
MSFRAALHLALWLGLLGLLGGCANLPFLSPTPDAAAPEVKRAAQYQLEVNAPSELRELLLKHLDLARLQHAAEADSLTLSELDRLVVAAVAQSQSILETEGYFNARVQVVRVPDSTDKAGLPVLRVDVEPGPRAVVDRLTLQVQGGLEQAVQAGDPAALALLERLQREWALQPGRPFQQSAWDSAKNGMLATLRSQGYLAAGWSGTTAQVDARTNSVRLFLVADSDALFRIGPIRVAGLERFDEGAVLPLAHALTGQPATEQVLRDVQDRILSLGLFASVVIDVETDPQHAQAAPVLVAVRELTLQQATVGIGYSDDVGLQLTLEHTHRRVFGTRWIATNKFQLGPNLKSWQGDLISHPLEDGYRNLLAGQAEDLFANDETRLSWRARAGRTRDTSRIWRLYYAEYAWAKLETTAGVNESSALSANYHWSWRDVDNLRSPTRGSIWSLQGAAGATQGSATSATTHETQDGAGPFARAYARVTGFMPLASTWYSSARIELGQVFVQQALTVPDTLLFRAGGDDSVRGYAYRSLGPLVNGAVVSGSSLFTASLQLEHPIWDDEPALLWAVFVDAGNASDGWNNMRPALGYGLGVHWRSLVGPLRFDVAYGQEVHRLRLHFTVGVSF